MSISRRSFVTAVSIGAASFLPEARSQWSPGIQVASAAEPVGEHVIYLDKNENPNGPSERVRAAITERMARSNRYPIGELAEFVNTLAKIHNVQRENILVAAGSSPLLDGAVQSYAAPTKAVVTGVTSYGDPISKAQLMGFPVKEVPMDPKMRLDLEAMAAAASDGGLIYVCNPNNPTATVHGADTIRAFVDHVGKVAPTATILIDEAYFEYVGDPSYATAVPIAMSNPRVIVARTFSKLYGLAGLRIGYMVGKPETLRPISRWQTTFNYNQLGLAAANAAVTDTAHIAEEQKRNAEVRAYTKKFFDTAGYQVAGADGNFMQVDIKRDVKKFSQACAEKNVHIARVFPSVPTHARITFGTMDQMQKATDVFRVVLAAT